MSKIGQDVVSEKPRRQIPQWVLAKIPKKPFRLEYVDGTIHVYSPYNPDFVTELKEKIPAQDRKWNPTDKRWEVSDRHDKIVKELGNKYYGMSEEEFIKEVKEKGKIAFSYDGYETYLVPKIDRLIDFAKSYGQSSDKFYVPTGSIVHVINRLEPELLVYIAKPGFFYKPNTNTFESYLLEERGFSESFLPEIFRNIRYSELFDVVQSHRLEDILKLSDEKIVELINAINSVNNLYHKRRRTGWYPYADKDFLSFIEQLDVNNPQEVKAALEAYFKIVA